MVLVEDTFIDIAQVLELLDGVEQAESSEAASWQHPACRDASTLREARSYFERSFIFDKLKEHDWNISKTADAIGIERSNLYRKMRSYSIDVGSDKLK